MRARVRRTLISVFLLTLAGAAFAQDVVTIPVAAVVQRGKATKFRYVCTMDMTAAAEGQTFPMNFGVTVTQLQKYGKPGSDGLIPVTMTLGLSNLKGSFAGKSLEQMVGAKARELSKLGKMPTIISYFSRAGDVRKVKVSGIPQPKGRGGKTAWLPQTQEMAVGATSLALPVGEVVLGGPIEKVVTVPGAGAPITFKLTYTPVGVQTVGGEQAVQFLVNAEAPLDLGSIARQAGAGGQFSGTAHVQMDGEMFVGLRTGELIRQDVNITLAMSMGTGGKSLDAALEMAAQGYRLQ